MALASHLGPWLLGTVKNTSGTTAGTIRNMGATEVAQTAPLSYTDLSTGTLMVIPAGSLITSISYYVTSAYGSATSVSLVVLFNGVGFSSVSIPNGGAGIYNIAPSSGPQTTTFANTGTADTLVTVQQSLGSPYTGGGVLVIKYIVRNSDGTYVASAQTA